MRKISLKLLQDSDDATLERIAREYPKAPNPLLFERAYQGYLEQLEDTDKQHLPIKRHWAKIVSLAACCLLIVGAALLWRMPPHQIPTVPDERETAAETDTVACTEHVLSEIMTQQTVPEPSAQFFSEPPVTDVQETQVAIQATEQQSEPNTEDIPAVQVPEPTEPTEELHPSISYEQSDTAKPEPLPGFTILQQKEHIEVVYQGDTSPSPEDFQDYTTISDAYSIDQRWMIEGSEPITCYRICTSDPERIITVEQRCRERFSVEFNEPVELYPVALDTHPGFYAEFSQGFIVLYWDDGAYLFSVMDSDNDMAVMQEIAESFINCET